MNKNIQNYSMLFALFIFTSSVRAQSVSFTYDAAGNRISHSITVNRVRERITMDMEETAAEMREERVRLIVDSSSDILTIDVTGYHDEDKGSVSLFSLSGYHVRDVTVRSAHTQIDLNGLPQGVYVVRVTLNGKAETWKVEIRQPL